MEITTTNLLTAPYSVSHRIALTAEEVAELDRDWPSLSPALWPATKALLAGADRGVAGTTLDIGFLPLVLRWLDLPDDDAFSDEMGARVVEALQRDLGHLAEIAGALESPGVPDSPPTLMSETLALELSVVWSQRGACLMKARPQAASAAVQTLERAVAHYPWCNSQYRHLLKSVALACEACGDWERHRAVHGQIQDFDREVGSRAEVREACRTAALVLSILWCITHDDLLLDAERGIEPAVRPSPEVWARVCASVEAGDLDGVPVPVRTCVAWTGDETMDSELLRWSLEGSRGLLAEMIAAVERLWGGPQGGRPASSLAVTLVQGHP